MGVTTGTTTTIKCAKCGKVLRKRSTSAISPPTALDTPILTCACGMEYFDEGAKEYSMMTAVEKKKTDRKWVFGVVSGGILIVMGALFSVGGMESGICSGIYFFGGLFTLIGVSTYSSTRSAIRKSNARMADPVYVQKLQRLQSEYDDMLRAKCEQLRELFRAAEQMKK